AVDALLQRAIGRRLTAKADRCAGLALLVRVDAAGTARALPALTALVGAGVVIGDGLVVDALTALADVARARGGPNANFALATTVPAVLRVRGVDTSIGI